MDTTDSAAPTTPMEATYRFSAMRAETAVEAQREDSRPPRSGILMAQPPGANASDVFVRGSIVNRGIEVSADVDVGKSGSEQSQKYNGRHRRWPGLLLFLGIVAVATSLIVVYGNKAHDKSGEMAKAYEDELFRKTMIRDQHNNSHLEELVEDDGAIGNPKKYAKTKCELPNYLSKNGQIVAVSKNGTEVNLRIKGINWFGMETGQAAPLGLWENTDNGTTAYQIASFLARNKFNAVRLPIMVKYVLTNPVPNTAIINKSANRALNVASYLGLLKSLIKALQFRNIGVLISIHTLTDKPEGGQGALWYDEDISEAKFLEAIGILTTNLCSDEYWNVMGLDLKNEPWKGTWGDGSPTDFRDGAKRIANAMLAGCDRWMGFVEGVNGNHKLTLDGEVIAYSDWYGGGLQGARTHGLEFALPDKVVWAPHYYNPALAPQRYLYGGGKPGPQNSLLNYVELDDATLRRRVQATMDDMFGFLATPTGPAVVLGEFGGLYATDKHPKKTTQRCTDYTMEVIKNWAGGFVWCLNPESKYEFNPADTPGKFIEGVLTDDWLGVNGPFLKGLEAMDDMPNLRPFPCFRSAS